jgi:hypothetical protein
MAIGLVNHILRDAYIKTDKNGGHASSRLFTVANFPFLTVF